MRLLQMLPDREAKNSDDDVFYLFLRSQPFTIKCARDAVPPHPLHFAELR
jgi:hypothetical protein